MQGHHMLILDHDPLKEKINYLHNRFIGPFYKDKVNTLLTSPQGRLGHVCTPYLCPLPPIRYLMADPWGGGTSGGNRWCGTGPYLCTTSATYQPSRAPHT